jgi:hypothetical protein
MASCCAILAQRMRPLWSPVSWREFSRLGAHSFFIIATRFQLGYKYSVSRSQGGKPALIGCNGGRFHDGFFLFVTYSSLCLLSQPSLSATYVMSLFSYVSLLVKRRRGQGAREGRNPLPLIFPIPRIDSSPHSRRPSVRAC